MTTEREVTALSPLMTLVEVSEYSKIPVATLRFWRHKGIGPRSFLLAGRIVFKRSEIKAYVESQYENGVAG